MKATITSIELKGPFKFFALSAKSMRVIKQLRSTGCVQYKSRGLWTKHYTMSLWKNTEDIKSFAQSGAHLEAMKDSKELAKEIRTITIDAEELPSWTEAKRLLQEGKVIRY